MNKWVYLSHQLNATTPAYRKGEGFRVQKVSSIAKGDTSNNSFLRLSSHLGTHIDSPYHFDKAGYSLDQLTAEEWVFSNVHVIEYQALPDEMLGGSNWLAFFEQIPVDTDLLLVKTGFERYREASLVIDDSLYIFHNPGWLPEAGLWLREHRNIRVMGFDFISLTSYENRSLGWQAHRAFLASQPDGTADDWKYDPIMIIEDMKLSELAEIPEVVIATPLLFEGADGSPVTVLAKFKI